MVLEKAQAEPVATQVAVEEAPTCRHHWVIEPANGPSSRGKCRKCHEVRAFSNSIYEHSEPDS